MINAGVTSRFFTENALPASTAMAIAIQVDGRRR